MKMLKQHIWEELFVVEGNPVALLWYRNQHRGKKTSTGSDWVFLFFLLHGMLEETEHLWKNMLNAKHDEQQLTEADCPPMRAGFKKIHSPIKTDLHLNDLIDL